MADFNKGDFTQQGVDGHVRATLRLNEKRYVNLDLTTNENARGVTISGKVIDELNNLEYPIGGVNPTGNIAITENTAEGEPLDVSQYATATVNVQSGLQPSSTTQKTLDNFSYTCVYDNEEYIYDTFGVPYVMNIKTGAVHYIYDNTEGDTYCSISGDGHLLIGDGTLANTPFYVNIDLTGGQITIFGVDTNAHHLTISFTATGYPVSIAVDETTDAQFYVYTNASLTNTYYLYLDPYGEGTGTRSGVIYTDLTNGVPRIEIVKFAGGPK